jgi:acylphosphatase
VQGVFFRASTREQAVRLGVNGYARNLLDGRVEVVACGNKDSVEALCEWLQLGPPHAQVEHCVCTPIPAKHFSGFSIS